MSAGVTFALMGHRASESVAAGTAKSRKAAGPDDRVWFVDSASTDDSAARAAALGVEVVRAPLGKGRAMAFALARCTTEYIVFIDGDMESSSENVAGQLRAAVDATGAAMVVGSFFEPAR